jgi:hypothetical protein
MVRRVDEANGYELVCVGETIFKKKKYQITAGGTESFVGPAAFEFKENDDVDAMVVFRAYVLARDGRIIS